jgi:hypothetical protein
MGGPDPTLSPRVYQESGADFLCLGEGELTIPLLLADLEAGRRSGFYPGKGQADLTRSPVPRFDLIDFHDYLYVGLQYSRGCPYTCEFCNVIELETPIGPNTGQVLAELDRARAGYRARWTFDDNPGAHEGQVLLRAWRNGRAHRHLSSPQHDAQRAGTTSCSAHAAERFRPSGGNRDARRGAWAARKPQNRLLIPGRHRIYPRQCHRPFRSVGLDGEPPTSKANPLHRRDEHPR